MKKRLIALILASLLALGVSACTPAETETALEQVTFVLDWTPNTNHTGIYVADALGYYEEEGLSVEIIQPAEDGAPLMVASGQAQYGVSFQEEFVAAIASESPLPITAVCAVLQHNTSGVVALKETGIASFRDLEGRTYASWGVPVYDEILFDAVRADGGDPEKIKIINNTATDTYAALQTDFDSVWIYYGWDGIIGEQKGYEINFMPFAESNPTLDYYTPILIANNAYLEEYPELVKAFLRATAKGYEYAIEHPDEAAQLLVDSVPEIDLAVAKASQAYLKDQYRAEALRWGWIDEARWSRFNDWMYEKNMISEDIGTAGFTNEFLPE